MMNDIPRTCRSLAVVLPRYGAGLGGGAETLVREMVLALKRRAEQDGNGPVPLKIEVWTTCARDHRTWENYHPAGVSLEDGIAVHRFPVDERNLEVFIGAELTLAQGLKLSVDQQLDWLAQGVNSKALYAHIARHGRRFDALLFAPYLFPTTFWGALIYPEKSIVIPCLHNEAYAYLEVFQQLLCRVAHLIFNTDAEMSLAAGLYGEERILPKATVVGMGFDGTNGNSQNGGSRPPEIAAAAGAPYLLYSGRKETGKNLDLLIDCFVRYKRERPGSPLELRLIGSGAIEFIDQLPEGVIDLGFVSDEEKQRLMSSAVALCQPSLNESFSIVMMEAWQTGTPVIVHERCAVTVEHVRRSGGGLYFASAADFAAVVDQLANRPELGRRLGEAGRRYVAEQYAWNAVLSRFDAALAAGVG